MTSASRNAIAKIRHWKQQSHCVPASVSPRRRQIERERVPRCLILRFTTKLLDSLKRTCTEPHDSSEMHAQAEAISIIQESFRELASRPTKGEHSLICTRVLVVYLLCFRTDCTASSPFVLPWIFATHLCLVSCTLTTFPEATPPLTH
jgi:hypothetical protein